jgi:hypothetical protein
VGLGVPGQRPRRGRRNPGDLVPGPRIRRTRTPRLDLPGVALAAAGLAGVVYGVIRAGDLDSWTTPEVYLPIAAGLVLLSAPAVFERRVS